MTPKERCERLLEAVVPFAEQMLNKYGEFYPFGASLANGGEIALVQPADEHESPASDELISIAKEVFRKRAAKQQITSSALVVNMTMRRSDSESKQDVVAVMLDDHEDYSVIVYYPYSKRSFLSKTFQLGEPFAQPGEKSIFQTAKP